MRRLLISMTTLLTLILLTGSAWAVDLQDISAEEYYAAAYFKQAQEHPKLASKSYSKQVRAVARDIRWKPKKLKKAIAKLEELGGDPIALAKSAIEKGFSGTRVDGRVLDVLINADEPKHVVVYVRWQGTKKAEAVKEASTIASVVSKKAPLVSTLSLSAIHPKAAKTSKMSVWSGKIGRGSMERIDDKRIEDYADRLYGRLFEGVESKPF